MKRLEWLHTNYPWILAAIFCLAIGLFWFRNLAVINALFLLILSLGYLANRFFDGFWHRIIGLCFSLLLLSGFVYLAPHTRGIMLLLVLLSVSLIGISVVIDSCRRKIENPFPLMTRVVSVLAITLLTVLISFSMADQIIGHAELERSQRDIATFQNRLDQRQGAVLEVAKSISSDPIFTKLLQEQRVSDLQRYSQTLMVAKDISYLVVTNNTGLVLVRSHKPESTGDVIMTDLPESAILFEGKTFADFAVADSEPALLGGAPITVDNKVIGGIIAGDVLSPGLANRISDNQGDLFFCSGTEQIGTSPYLIHSFKEGAGGLCEQSGKQSIRIVSSDHARFILSTSILRNIHSEVIGTMRLASNERPRRYAFLWCSVSILSIWMLLYLASQRSLSPKSAILWLRRKRPTLQQIRSMRISLLLPSPVIVVERGLFGSVIILAALGMGFSSFSLLHAEVRPGGAVALGTTPIVTPEQPTVSTRLETSVMRQGESTILTLLANTNGTKASAVSATLHFSPEYLQVVKAEVNTAFCGSKMTKGIDNDNGRIDISCDIVGDSSRNANSNSLVASISLSGTKPGVGHIIIDKHETEIETAGGTETRIIQGTASGDHLIILNTDNGLIAPLVPFVDSKQNDADWYQTNEIRVHWLSSEEKLPVKYCIGKEKGICKDYYITSDSGAALFVPDGVWYFNVTPIDEKKSLLAGSVLLNVDTTEPEELKPLIGSEEIEFALKDATSGIGHFAVTVDNTDFANAQNPFKLPELSSGRHSVRATATDNAGNKRTYEFTVTK